MKSEAQDIIDVMVVGKEMDSQKIREKLKAKKIYLTTQRISGTISWYLNNRVTMLHRKGEAALFRREF